MRTTIAHVALWTVQPDELRDFYVHYFGGRSTKKYVNPLKKFDSYFVSFDGTCRLEIMRRKDICQPPSQTCTGFCHLAFGVSDRTEVVALTERLRADGHRIEGEPRITGDGYFESVVADPDGNLVEIVSKKI